MIDLHDVSNPEYYYYTINESDYNASIEEYNMYGEASYNLSNFIKWVVLVVIIHIMIVNII